MLVWLFNPYGPIPGEAWRPYRFALLGEALAARGHEVVWWTSSFAHHGKRQRAAGWEDRAIAPGFRIRLVPTPAYDSHVGLGRIRRDLVFGRAAQARGLGEQAADLVVSAESPLQYGYGGLRLAEALSVPYVVDVMDLWPELFDVVIPEPLRRASRLAFAPIYHDRARRWRRASAMTALSARYAEVAKEVRAGIAGPPVSTFYNGVDIAGMRAQAEAVPLDALPDGARREEGITTLVFAGTLGENYDIPVLLQAVARARSMGARVRLLVAGHGPMLSQVKAAAAESSEAVRYLGQLDQAVLAAVYRQADIGVCAYGPQSNVGMPDKLYDYTAGGLSVLNSLPGEVEALVRDEGIGRQYWAGDVASLAAAIGELAADPVTCAAMARRSQDAASRFDQAVQYPAFAAFLEDVVLSALAPSPLVTAGEA